MRKLGWIFLLVLMGGCTSAMQVTKPAPLNIEMVKVESGTYQKGKDYHKSRLLSETGVKLHDVTLTYDFLMAKYEITVEQFISVFNYGIETGRLSLSEDFSFFNGRKDAIINERSINIWDRWLFRLPQNQYGFDELVIVSDGKLSLGRKDSVRKAIVGVSWYGAVWFCNLLSEIEGYEAYYTIGWNDIRLSGKIGGYRLATEGEWEWAARGGRFSKGFKYIGSNEMDKTGLGSVPGKTVMGPTIVGQYVANELGIYDLAGNATEWVFDYFGPETDAPAVNPTGPKEGYERVMKGGAWGWGAFPPWLRESDPPSSSFDRRAGIRVVRDIL